ncbi:MAG: Serine/threonine-protein phosphatase 1 [Syntrophus sp. PtaU1.Bin208]|nr:MAG: Serine/threonine-protein phosphatase 1 [Syntrophus sp. PtaU1.Bin208]
MERIFAIGDIHGCLEQLKGMISLLDIDRERDTLVFVGDYIDRGPDSKGVVDFILELKRELKHVVCLRGNHEEMFLDFYRDGKNGPLFLRNGGRDTLSSYGLKKTAGRKTFELPEAHLQFLTALTLYFETEDFVFVHAGLRPGLSLEEQDPYDLLWIRHEFFFSEEAFPKVVVFGHTPFSQPLLEENKIGIDTGAVYGGKLTCIELPDRKIYQV